jgi:hypothetical protein
MSPNPGSIGSGSNVFKATRAFEDERYKDTAAVRVAHVDITIAIDEATLIVLSYPAASK